MWILCETEEFFKKMNGPIFLIGQALSYYAVTPLLPWTPTGRFLEQSGRSLNLLRSLFTACWLCWTFLCLNVKLWREKDTFSTKYIFITSGYTDLQDDPLHHIDLVTLKVLILTLYIFHAFSFMQQQYPIIYIVFPV